MSSHHNLLCHKDLLISRTLGIGIKRIKTHCKTVGLTKDKQFDIRQTDRWARDRQTNMHSIPTLVNQSQQDGACIRQGDSKCLLKIHNNFSTSLSFQLVHIIYTCTLNDCKVYQYYTTAHTLLTMSTPFCMFRCSVLGN